MNILGISKVEYKKNKWYIIFLALVVSSFVASNFLGYRYFNFTSEVHSTEPAGSGGRSHYYHK